MAGSREHPIGSRMNRAVGSNYCGRGLRRRMSQRPAGDPSLMSPSAARPTIARHEGGVSRLSRRLVCRRPWLSETRGGQKSWQGLLMASRFSIFQSPRRSAVRAVSWRPRCRSHQGRGGRAGRRNARLAALSGARARHGIPECEPQQTKHRHRHEVGEGAGARTRDGAISRCCDREFWRPASPSGWPSTPPAFVRSMIA